MTVCSLVVRARPGQLPAVRRRLTSIRGVEVHACSDTGKLIVTVDLPTSGELSDAVARLGDLEGVLGASMVYHYCEHEEAT